MLDALYLKLLRNKSGIPATETDAGTEFQSLYDDEFLSYILEEASFTHNRKPFMQNLDELPAVFVLARIEIFTILAGAFAKNYDIGSKDGKLTKSQPFEHYQKLINELSITYDTLTSSSRVRSTPVLLSNKSRHLLRNHRNAPTPTIKLDVVGADDGEIQFRVISMSTVGVSKFDVYLSDEPIFDLVEPDHVNPVSRLVQNNMPYTTNTYRVTKNTDDSFLGVMAKNKYGKQYLLEFDTSTLADPPQDGEVV